MKINWCPTCKMPWKYSQDADKCLKCGRPKKAKHYKREFRR